MSHYLCTAASEAPSQLQHVPAGPGQAARNRGGSCGSVLGFTVRLAGPFRHLHQTQSSALKHSQPKPMNPPIPGTTLNSKAL